MSRLFPKGRKPDPTMDSSSWVVQATPMQVERTCRHERLTPTLSPIDEIKKHMDTGRTFSAQFGPAFQRASQNGPEILIRINHSTTTKI
jgi:hypothetical protein